MTTYSYTITLNDTERIALDAALAMLKEECELQIANRQEAPYLARLRSIASIKDKLANSGQQVSGSPC